MEIHVSCGSIVAIEDRISTVVRVGDREGPRLLEHFVDNVSKHARSPFTNCKRTGELAAEIYETNARPSREFGESVLVKETFEQTF